MISQRTTTINSSQYVKKTKMLKISVPMIVITAMETSIINEMTRGQLTTEITTEIMEIMTEEKMMNTMITTMIMICLTRLTALTRASLTNLPGETS